MRDQLFYNDKTKSCDWTGLLGSRMLRQCIKYRNIFILNLNFFQLSGRGEMHLLKKVNLQFIIRFVLLLESH